VFAPADAGPTRAAHAVFDAERVAFDAT